MLETAYVRTLPASNLVGRHRTQRLELPGAARLQMIGVCKSRSNLVAIGIIQNILNLNVALFLVRVIGQRARDLIGKLIGGVFSLISNGIRFLRFFCSSACCVASTGFAESLADESVELPPIEPTAPTITSTTMTPRTILPIGFFPSFAIIHPSYDPATVPAHSTS